MRVNNMLDTLEQDYLVLQRFSLCGKRWKYRGEGNANLVLALTQERKIVRLRKYENGGGPAEVSEDEERQRVLLETLFCRALMVPLLGDMYIQPPTAVYLELMDVRGLDQMLRAQRPVSRHHKGLRFCYATVYPDYALLPLHLTVSASPTFCLEVKPKQGWIPTPDRRLSKCTFCLNQYLKLRKGTVKTVSRYCPLDLFSGNHSRMKQALRHLVATPQNNLKIFEDGVLVYGEESGADLYKVLHRWMGTSAAVCSVDKFCDLIHDALLRKSCPGEVDAKESDVPSILCHSTFERVPSDLIASVNAVLAEPRCNWSSEPLPAGCILDRILKIQKLEQCGADYVYNIYRSSSQCPAVSDYSYLSDMIESESDLTPLHRYLLATTAKDCSIMIAFQRLSFPSNDIPPHHVIHDTDGQCYVFNIGVSDLDPKPLSCVEKHHKRDYEILSACLEVFAK